MLGINISESADLQLLLLLAISYGIVSIFYVSRYVRVGICIIVWCLTTCAIEIAHSALCSRYNKPTVLITDIIDIAITIVFAALVSLVSGLLWNILHPRDRVGAVVGFVVMSIIGATISIYVIIMMH